MMKIQSTLFVAFIFSTLFTQAHEQNNPLNKLQTDSKNQNHPNQQRPATYHIVFNASNKSNSKQEADQKVEQTSIPTTKVETAIVQKINEEPKEKSNTAAIIALAIYCPPLAFIYNLFSK